MTRVLFIAWDGPQVSYLEGLFLPIFQRLEKAGYQFHVLQFTWGDRRKISASRQACEAAGVAYRFVRVWRNPVGSGAVLTAVVGARHIRRALKSWSIDLVMPRSNMPALATLLALRKVTVPVIFDADGLPLDERVDFCGASASGVTYRVLRDVESQVVRRADTVLVRSPQAIEILLARAGAGTAREKFHIVGNGRDANVFFPGDELSRREARVELGIEAAAPLLVYAGSLGDQYCLNEMLVLFQAVRKRRANARLLILTGSPELARSALSVAPALDAASVVMSVEPGAVPRYLACADLGLALRRPSFSMQAVAPIKIGEYLLCGVPVLATAAVAETSIIGEGAGFVINRMSDGALGRAAEWFCERVLRDRSGFSVRCRGVGVENFSLDGSAKAYLHAFRSIKHRNQS